MTHMLLAYIDPGSGSLLIQVVIATIVAVPFFFRTQIARLARFAREHRGGRSEDDRQTPD